MAITHFSPQIIGRAEGRSAVLSAAYRHCARMEHEAEARMVDYSAKQGLAHEEFLLPADAPDWARRLIADRSVAGAAEAFWNRVEAFEKRVDAQFAKDYVIALPVELSLVQNIALVRQFVAEQVLARGQVADWVLHDEPGNPHVHLMTTLRPLTDTGFGGKKVAVMGDDSQPARTEAGKIRYRLWAGEKGEFLQQRQGWLDLQNLHLARAGLDIKVDGRSYAEQGIGFAPTTHIGVAAKAITRKCDAAGRVADLDRVFRHEATRRDNARRIEKRPQTVLDLVTAEKSVFDQRDIAKIIHRYVDDPGSFQRLLARVLARPECLRLDVERVDPRTGALTPPKLTTRAMIRTETEMAARASWLARARGFSVAETLLAATLARHARLSEEQKAAMWHVTRAERIAAIVGRAGAGKTTMMRAAREAWEAAGYRVVGGTLAGKAAEGLASEAGIASRTLASWELRWKEGRDRLDGGTIFVMDEAGMVASRQMAGFVKAASQAGAKLVLVGDADQLQPIDAGAAFRAITERIGYAELETVYRQSETWMRSASLDLARGNVAAALAAYRSHGKLVSSPLKAEAVEKLISSWNRDYDPNKSSLILAHLRRDVRALNILAREKLVERGMVGAGFTYTTQDGARHFDAGDQIVFLQNDPALGVKNGMIGRVLSAAPGRIVAEVGEGHGKHQVEVVAQRYRHIDHGYATTIHKSQGTTVDQVKVLASLSLDRHLTYVAMTRHRQDLEVHYGRRSFQIAGGLERLLGQRNTKETTLDYADVGFYRQALNFANRRGLHLMRVARTLVRDRLDWTLRQKTRLAELGQALLSVGARLRLFDANEPARPQPTHSAAPMVQGITRFAMSVSDAAQQQLQLDAGLAKQWDILSGRIRSIYVEPDAALRAMRFETLLTDAEAARNTVLQIEQRPRSFGQLRGREGLFAGKADRRDREVALANLPALRRDIERFVRMREAAMNTLIANEQVKRQKVAIDIPALSPAATAVLGRVGDAIDRDDLPAALEFAPANGTLKAEIDAFSTKVSERFGDRTLLSSAAKEAHGPAFDKAALGLPASERRKLATAWPLLRAGQQLAAHERSAKALQEAEALHQSQRLGVALK
ncbi:Ti-type conjugative transfer relaxase TraA [Mesorhizobium sp. CAU 1741]|uniref:Ti-type conjugative transfer relaxase TraA n=1 Tax=Mesorhizobium sp. CAU 1741 TaxID=3140366 RepID=UPI00325AF662